ncbi:RNA-binding protein [Croceivirga radicis]|uniref:RNA-binding protein n=2 Tax=Croceivirga radicis TaxID=1929488 RepID=A0A1V6LQX3_9FLAO|nr:RNA-binding protein [Croceivirga radicis]
MIRVKKSALFVLVILVFFSCTDKKDMSKEVQIQPAHIYFNSLDASKTGIEFINNLTFRDSLNIIDYLYYYNGGGVALGDINNDGLDDIYLSANQSTDKLYLNLGGFKFKEITKEAGLKIDSTWSSGVTMEDINNDGFLDIYVCKVGKYKDLDAKNLLYINNGNNTFTEKAETYGLAFSGLSTQASFFDMDNDGDMDMYLMNHSTHTTRSYNNISARDTNDPISGDRLYENLLSDGQQIFKDVTDKSGIYSSPLGYGLALNTSDVNDDGYIDIYVGNDFHENDYLYLNQGDKTFKEVGQDYLGHTTRFTMGVDVMDMNMDNKLDIFTLDMMPNNNEIFLKSGGEDSDKVAKIKENYGFGDQYARNTFQLNQGGHFTDVALLTNTFATDWSWSVLLQDFDLDGLNDIYITNGIYKRPNDLDYIKYLSNVDFSSFTKEETTNIKKELIEKMPTIKLPNTVFKNNGNLNFEPFTLEAGQEPSYSNGAAYSDLDNDGDLDLVVNNINQPVSILENTSERDNNNYSSLKLDGNELLHNTNGAKVYLYSNNKVQRKDLSTVKGFQSTSTRILSFGLGNSNKIDSVKVKWLDGTEDVFLNVPLNQTTVLNKTVKAKKQSTPQSLSHTFTTFPYVHLENNYLDYERESLIPEKLSTEGPCVVYADFNNDSLPDLYLGGAKYQSPSLFINAGNGDFELKKVESLLKDGVYEDTDAVALDIDNDGDLDLYVMSGGNDNAEGSDYLEDRIYINDGAANFRRLPLDMLKNNGGSVSTIDFNKDGHLDLFIGNRSIPGGYGLSPSSYILASNGKGQFNVAAKLRMGMVTDSQWADINQDGLPDLVVVGDWMPVSIYLNKGENKFENATQDFGLENTNGMWNTVKVIDLNKDGNLEILAGNTGLNHKWKASKEKPIKLYLDDFDKNTQLDPIIFYDFFGSYVPFANKDNLSGQIPSLKKRFPDYSSFASVNSLNDLFPNKEETVLEIKEIKELRSMLFNLKNGKYTGTVLPVQAQFSTIEDFAIDLEKKQILYVGNYTGFVNELGNTEANAGGIIKYTNTLDLKHKENLELPPFINARKIIPLNKTDYLVLVNNGSSYKLKQRN